MHWLASHQGLESLIAASARFQELVEAGDADAAKSHVHFGGTETDSTRPWALITCRGCVVREVIRRGEVVGNLVLSLEIPASAYSVVSGRKAKLAAFLGDIDTILGEMRSASLGRAVNWNMAEVEGVVAPRLVAPRHSDPDPDRAYYLASFRIGWV